MQQSQARGRPYDAQSGRALKAAALKLMGEKGYAGVSIAAITAAAGVARQTLYNRWNGKADLVLEALFEEADLYAAAPVADAETASAQLLERFLRDVFGFLAQHRDVMAALIAAAQSDAAFNTALRERFVLPRERIVTELLERAQARGELSAGRDPQMLSAFVHGAFWYRLLNDQPLDAALAQAITKEIFAG